MSEYGRGQGTRKRNIEALRKGLGRVIEHLLYESGKGILRSKGFKQRVSTGKEMGERSEWERQLNLSRYENTTRKSFPLYADKTLNAFCKA